MIRIKDHKQNDLFDHWRFLSPKRRKILDQSWAGLFQKELLCELPVSEVAPFFNDGFGRPTKELYTVLGAIVLQQAHDLTDEETVNQLAFNIQWHYALNITEESDSAKYMCPKTLWNMRSIVVDNALDAVLFDHITDKLSKVFKVNTDNQRIDSVHITSNPTCSGHKGQGYQVQVMETYCKDEDAKEESLNLITHVEVEPAHESDANAMIAAIESTKERGLAPEELLTDSLYGSDENCQEAKQMGVEVVAPVMGSKKEDAISLSDFEVSEKGDVISCSQGRALVRTKTKKTRHTVAFDPQHCSNCPFQGNCPVKQGKKYHDLRYTDKEMRLAKRGAYERTEEFKDCYRWRAGVEATMSEYDRKTGGKHLRVRGFKTVRFCATLKAVGVNIFRATAVRKVASCNDTAHGSTLSGQIHAVFVVKEHFLMTWSQLKNIFTLFLRSYEYMPIMAA